MTSWGHGWKTEGEIILHVLLLANIVFAHHSVSWQFRYECGQNNNNRREEASRVIFLLPRHSQPHTNSLSPTTNSAYLLIDDVLFGKNDKSGSMIIIVMHVRLKPWTARTAFISRQTFLATRALP